MEVLEGEKFSLDLLISKFLAFFGVEVLEGENFSIEEFTKKEEFCLGGMS